MSRTQYMCGGSVRNGAGDIWILSDHEYLHMQRIELNSYPVGFVEFLIPYKQESGMIRF